MRVQNGWPSPKLEVKVSCEKSFSTGVELLKGFSAVGMASVVALDTESTANPAYFK